MSLIQALGNPLLASACEKAVHKSFSVFGSVHGMVAGGRNLDSAMWAAVELETLSRQYYHAKLAGAVTILPDSEMATVLEKFKTYGQSSKDESCTVEDVVINPSVA